MMKKENYEEASMTTLAKVFVLVTYIRENFIERVMINFAKAIGPKEFSSVFFVFMTDVDD
jgi:hypothetical protein